jgi:hypothetical protein
MEHKPLCFFDNLEEFDFHRDAASRIIQKPKSLAEPPYKVEKIIGRRELTPRAIEYQVQWVGYPKKKDYTWEPVWQLKADVPKLVKAYERKQRDLQRKQGGLE